MTQTHKPANVPHGPEGLEQFDSHKSMRLWHHTTLTDLGKRIKLTSRRKTKEKNVDTRRGSDTNKHKLLEIKCKNNAQVYIIIKTLLNAGRRSATCNEPPNRIGQEATLQKQIDIRALSRSKYTITKRTTKYVMSGIDIIESRACALCQHQK